MLIYTCRVLHSCYPFDSPSAEAGFNIGGSFLMGDDVYMRRKIYCPYCGKWLFTTEGTTNGTVYIWCRSCRKEIEIKIEPLSQ